MHNNESGKVHYCGLLSASVSRSAPPSSAPFNEDDKCLPRRTPTPKASLLKQEDWEKSLN